MNPPAYRPPRAALGIVEMVVVLSMLNGLFMAFVIVQFRYLFGGASLVDASVSLTYAEYARRGFFELVVVAALLLPVLLLADWMLRAEKRSQVRLFRALSALLVALLFVIMASAVQRMRLYQSEFGLTELRLYTTAFMGMLAAVFLWFLATVPRGLRERFAFGALIAGFAAIAVLNILNPDDFIVRANADRIREGNAFDASYAASLSGDAVPALIQVYPALDLRGQAVLLPLLPGRWSPSGSPDWRIWNWGRVQAVEAVKSNEYILH